MLFKQQSQTWIACGHGCIHYENWGPGGVAWIEASGIYLLNASRVLPSIRSNDCQNSIGLQVQQSSISHGNRLLGSKCERYLEFSGSGI